MHQVPLTRRCTTKGKKEKGQGRSNSLIKSPIPVSLVVNIFNPDGLNAIPLGFPSKFKPPSNEAVEITDGKVNSLIQDPINLMQNGLSI